MRRAFWITLIFTVLATVTLLSLGKPAWFLGLWTGSLWGLANAWCLVRTARCVVSGKRSWRLAGWIGMKFIGLYGLLVWLLIGWRVSPVGWLIGFTISLAGLGVAFGLPPVRAELVEARTGHPFRQAQGDRR